MEDLERKYLNKIIVTEDYTIADVDTTIEYHKDNLLLAIDANDFDLASDVTELIKELKEIRDENGFDTIVKVSYLLMGGFGVSVLVEGSTIDECDYE